MRDREKIRFQARITAECALFQRDLHERIRNDLLGGLDILHRRADKIQKLIAVCADDLSERVLITRSKSPVRLGHCVVKAHLSTSFHRLSPFSRLFSRKYSPDTEIFSAFHNQYAEIFRKSQ